MYVTFTSFQFHFKRDYFVISIPFTVTYNIQLWVSNSSLGSTEVSFSFFKLLFSPSFFVEKDKENKIRR